MSSYVHALAERLFRKFQQISATATRVYFKKKIISTTGEYAMKKNSAAIVFLCCDINQFKSLKISSP